LLTLADFLAELPPERFNYESWVGEDWDGKPDLSCGTTACALGWACTMPAFRRLGATLIKKWGGGQVCLKDDPNSDSYDVSLRLFDLNAFDHEHLFVGEDDFTDEVEGLDFDATPKQAARHIRKFVKRRCPEALQ
jgi:hypothetical protein